MPTTIPTIRLRSCAITVLVAAMVLQGCSGSSDGDAPTLVAEPASAAGNPLSVTPDNPSAGTPTDPNDGGDVVAAPEAPAAALQDVPCDADEAIMQAHTLSLINEARAVERQCGNDTFTAVPALAWDSRLQDAAHGHSNDMALHNFFSHTGSDGLSVADRVTASGYTWRGVGENIAAGQRTARQAIDGWLASPGHCRNLMSSRFAAVAVACVQASDTGYKHFWTQVFANPR